MRNAGRFVVVTAAVLMSGCGLVDALDKLKHGVTFDLPAQTYSVRTDQPAWRSPPPSGIPPLPCGPGQLIADCCAAPVDCQSTPLVCDAEKCALKFNYEEVKQVNLSEVAAVKSSNGMVFTDVLLKELDLDVDNQLNVSTPPVNLYVAPMNATSSSAAGAQMIAVIPSQPPGFKGKVTVPLDASAQQIFSTFARATQTPFNVILSAPILVKSGDPVPAGHVDFIVSGKVEAKL
jgi:hypothetical protein